MSDETLEILKRVVQARYYIEGTYSCVPWAGLLADGGPCMGYRIEFVDGRPSEYVYLVPAVDGPELHLFQGTVGHPRGDEELFVVRFTP